MIGYGHDPLLIRYTLFRVPAFGIYLHRFIRSDYDRALHDHPWPFVSILLRGGYTEVHNQTIDGKETKVLHRRGTVLVRPAEWKHRVELSWDLDNTPTWTLVLVGRRQRQWGFWIDGKWCWWQKHDPERNACAEEIIHKEG